MTVILALFDETTYGLARHIDERYPREGVMINNR